MSEPADLSKLTSKKGWVSIDYDERTWIPCPPVFPAGIDRESIAAGVARIWWEQSGIRHKPSDVGRLAEMLSMIHEGTYGKIPCHLAFIHLPDPRLLPLVLYVGVWEAVGDKNEQLRMFCHAADPEAVERPVAEEFTTDRLGTGLRVIRYRNLPDGALYAGLAYAWRFRSAALEQAKRRGVALPMVRGVVDPSERAQAIGAALDKHPSATALLVHNDAALVDLPRLLCERRMEIPRDLSVVSIFPEQFGKTFALPYTAIDTGCPAVAARAVELLVSRLAEPEGPVVREFIDLALVDRGSSAVVA